MSAAAGTILGWDVGGTKSAAVVGTAGGEIVARDAWPSQACRGHEAMIEDFLGRAAAMVRQHAPRAVGVSIGGPMNARTGTILSPPHLPGWDAVPLRQILECRLKRPVVIEHDAAACLLAEWLWGAARGCTHAIYLTCGTGCGAGVLVGGRILRGPHGQSPEVGHVRLADDGPELFGKAGCVESFCSGEGIGLLARRMFPDRFAVAVTPEALVREAASGDEAAEAVLAEAGRRTGQLCAILADVFAPQVIVLGTLSRHLGRGYLDAIEGEFRREALAANSRHTKITPAALGERLQDLSAIAPVVFRKRRDGDGRGPRS